MTDKEIVKALECWSKEYGCEGCPFIDNGCFDCGNGNIPYTVFQNILALINRQKETIELLQTALFKCGEEMAEKQATISRRMGEIDMMFTKFETIAAEAVKEFSERLKEQLKSHAKVDCFGNYYYLLGFPTIDNLVKEFTEGENT